MQTKTLCGYYMIWMLYIFCGKNNSRTDLGGFNTFYWNCFQKDPHSLQSAALVSVRTNIQGFENVTHVNNGIIFWSYRHCSFKAFEDLLFLGWTQLLIPLAVLGMTPFWWKSAPLFSYSDRIENVPDRKAGAGLVLTLSLLGTLARVNFATEIPDLARKRGTIFLAALPRYSGE